MRASWDSQHEPLVLIFLYSAFLLLGFAASSSAAAAPIEAGIDTSKWNPELAKALLTPTAYERAQDPYKSRVNTVFQGIDVCKSVSEAAAQQLWTLSGLPGKAPAGFSNKVESAKNFTIWSYPLLLIVSTVTDTTGQWAAGSPPEKLANIVPGNPPLYINDVTRIPLADHTFASVVAPNSDTLYSLGWLDLSGGPIVLHIPDSKGRFNVQELLDAYTNIPLTVGSLNSPKGKDLDYVLVPPGYDGPKPSGYDYYAEFTTDLVWIIGRVYTTTDDEDLEEAVALQYGITWSPLFPDDYKLPTKVADLAHAAVQAAIHPSAPGSGNLSAWWPLLQKALDVFPPFTPIDKEEARKFKEATGVRFTALDSGLPPTTKLALNLGLAAGLSCIDWLVYNETDLRILPKTATGWSAPANGIKLDTSLGYVTDPELVGGFYTDPLLRAFIAKAGLGANPPKTAVYYKVFGAVLDPTKPVAEQKALPLDASLYNYTLTFPTPPNVTGFWSLTIYREADILFFGDLPYDSKTNTFRYNINTDTKGFDFNGGKDFTIYISSTPPPKGTEEYDNWLPVGRKPDSKFVIYFRLYGPDEAAQSNKYNPPPLVAHVGTYGKPAALIVADS